MMNTYVKLENGLLTFMEMFIKDEVDLLKVTVSTIPSSPLRFQVLYFF